MTKGTHERIDMAPYYMIVKVLSSTKDQVFAYFNPQHGFGGMKGGEYIGTEAGEKVLQILKTEFCEPGYTWIIVNDEYNRTDLYDKAEMGICIGLDSNFRKRAIEENLTNKEILKFWDDLREMVDRQTLI